jgi:hypothetical protein
VIEIVEEVTGKPPLQVLREFLRGEEFLKKANGGAVKMADGGAVSPTYAQQRDAILDQFAQANNLSRDTLEFARDPFVYSQGDIGFTTANKGKFDALNAQLDALQVPTYAQQRDAILDQFAQANNLSRDTLEFARDPFVYSQGDVGFTTANKGKFDALNAQLDALVPADASFTRQSVDPTVDASPFFGGPSYDYQAQQNVEASLRNQFGAAKANELLNAGGLGYAGRGLFDWTAIANAADPAQAYLAAVAAVGQDPRLMGYANQVMNKDYRGWNINGESVAGPAEGGALPGQARPGLTNVNLVPQELRQFVGGSSGGTFDGNLYEALVRSGIPPEQAIRLLNMRGATVPSAVPAAMAAPVQEQPPVNNAPVQSLANDLLSSIFGPMMAAISSNQVAAPAVQSPVRPPIVQPARPTTPTLPTSSVTYSTPQQIDVAALARNLGAPTLGR